MGDWNLNTPNPRGMESRLAVARIVRLDSPTKAVAMRFKPGNVTIDPMHLYLSGVSGTPGLLLEHVDSLTPDSAVTIERHRPRSTATAATVTATNWTDNGGGAVDAADIDDEFSTSTFARNSTVISRNTAHTIQVDRSEGLAIPASKRVLWVTVWATVWLRKDFDGNDRTVDVQGYLSLNGANYRGDRVEVRRTRRFIQVPLHTWHLNPDVDTGLDVLDQPWTKERVDHVLGTDTDAWGMRVFGRAAINGFRVAALGVDVAYVTENRRSNFAQANTPRVGWFEYDVYGADSSGAGRSAVAAASANDWDWVVVSCPKASPVDYVDVPVLRPLAYLPAAAATDTLTEHREASELSLTSPGGVQNPNIAADTIANGEMIGVLFQTSGGATIQEQSQPFVEADTATIDSNSGTIAQEITTDSSVPTGGYGGVGFPARWATPGARPDQPLLVILETNAGSELTRAVVQPDEVASNFMADLVARFAAAQALSTATKYRVKFQSSATDGFGYIVPKLDTRSDRITTTTAAEVQGASVNGTTDSFYDGSADDRYDLPVALLAAPDAPTGFTATVLAAEGDTGDRLPNRVLCTWNPTTLGSRFGGFNLWKRRKGTPAEAWHRWGQVAVRDGYTAASVELFWREMTDTVVAGSRDNGWFEYGYEYGVTVVDAQTTMESALTTTAVDTSNVLTPAHTTWCACPNARWLEFPMPGDSDRRQRPSVDTLTGFDAARKHAIARNRRFIPGRMYDLDFGHAGNVDESILRTAWAAALSGEELALVDCRNDVLLGSIGFPDHSRRPGGVMVGAEFLTTAGRQAVADFNAQASVVLDSSDYLESVSHTRLEPGAGAFTAWYYGRAPALSAGIKVVLAKRQSGADGWELQKDASNIMTAIIDGTSAATLTDAGLLDDSPHLWCITTSGTAQVFYRDGHVVDSDAVSHGTVTNSDALRLNRRSGGTPAAGDLVPAFGYGTYDRVLTADEVTELYQYCAGWHAARAPAGATSHIWLPDDRCWNGLGTVAYDLALNGHDATFNGTPTPRGYPRPYRNVDEIEV